MIKGFLIVSGVYRKDYFYAETEAEALQQAKQCGWFEPQVKESRWFHFVDQHLSQPWLLQFEYRN